MTRDFFRRRAVPTALILLAIGGCASTPGTRLRVEGRKAHFFCQGSGHPTVVLEAGLGDTLATWSWVQPEVARFTRGCAYDRPGLGASAPVDGPRTSDRIVEELRGLLDGAAVARPYVLVGHSFGGLNVRLFASRYPERVTGLVLVDPTHEDFPSIERELRSEWEQRKAETNLALAPEAARAELAGIEESARQIREAPGFSGIPVLILSSGRPEGSPAFRETWTRLQKDLAERIPGATRLVSHGSGHYIQFDDPEMVVEAIRQIVDRAGGRPRGGVATAARP